MIPASYSFMQTRISPSPVFPSPSRKGRGVFLLCGPHPRLLSALPASESDGPSGMENRCKDKRSFCNPASLCPFYNRRNPSFCRRLTRSRERSVTKYRKSAVRFPYGKADGASLFFRPSILSFFSIYPEPRRHRRKRAALCLFILPP